MAWDENKKIKFVIDHNKVDNTLHDFPVTMKISDSCGINLVNLTTTSGTTASGTIFEEATSALSPNYDFTGTDGDGPDWRQWYLSGINAMTYCSIQNNKLNWNCDTASDAWIYSNYELVGDFDVQIDFDLVTHPETNAWEMHFNLSSTGFFVYFIREYESSTNRYRTIFYRLGVNAGGGATTSRDDITGKMRFVRTGGTVYCYYWNAGWVLQATSGFSDCTEPLRLVIRCWHSGGPGTVEGNYDNVQLNSGSVIWDHLRSKMAVYAGGDQNTGTRCFIDLDHWDTLNEEIVMHVGVPEISHTEDTELHLYYDEDNNTNANGYPFSWWASLTPEEASDSFTVSGTPNSALWYDRNTGSYVQDGRLVMDLSSGNTNDTLDSTYTIYGDFDIQVDWDAESAPTTDGWFMGLSAWRANEDLTLKRIFIRRRYNTTNGHHYDSGYHDGGGWTFANTATTSGSGKLRITREDHVMKMYYYESGWQLAQTGTLTSLDNVPMTIKLDATTYTGEPTVSLYFDNFTVNKAFIITDNHLFSDTFPESNYSQPNREKWRPYPSDSAEFIIKDNSLYIDDTGATSATMYNTAFADGDFDVQVDFDLLTWPSTDIGWAYLRVFGRDDSGLFMTGYIGRRYEVSRGGNIYFTSFYDGGWTGETNTATSDMSGKFRFYRDGNTIYAQYWNGANWVTTDSEDFGVAYQVYFYLQAGSSGSNAGVEVKYDNFKIDSARRIRGYMSPASGEVAANVWDPHYRLVCHFGRWDYPLGGYANRIYDSALYHLRGTAQSNMTYTDIVDGLYGKAFDFDGTDDVVDFGTLNPSSSDLTLEFLLNLDQLASDKGSSHHPIVKRDSWAAAGMMWQIHINSANDKLAFTNYTDWTGSQIGEFDTLIQRPGEWQNLAIVHDSGATDYMYADGSLIESHTAITFDSKTDSTIYIAANTAAGGGALDGKISEVRISNTVRTPTWLKSTYYSLFDDLLYIDWLPGPQGFDSTKYIQFFVDHSNIDNTLSNFPVRFRICKQSGIDNIDITRVFNELTVSGTSYPNRKKIAVTTAGDLAQCYVEIENWDHDREEANLWIKAPSISPQQQTEFYLYYDSTADDNTDWVGDTGDVAAQNVWDDNFMAVYHFSEITSKDSTGNYDATPNGIDSSNLSDGRSGEAFHLNGADEYVTQATLFDTVPANGTVSILFKSDVDSAGTDLTLFTKANDESGGAIDMLRFFWNADDIVGDRYMRVLKYNNNNLITLETPDDIDGSKFYLVSTTWGSAGAELYLDGDLVDSDVDTNPFGNGTTRDFAVGMYNWGGTPSQYWDGQIDEVRVSNKQRTASWEKATYHTLFDDMIYFHMPWDDTHSEIKLTISGSLINEDLTNFPLTLTLASGVGTNTEDVTKIFDGLTLSGTLGYSDDFTGWDGDVPDPLLWTLREDDGSETIQSNKFHCIAVDPGAGHFPGASAKFSLDNDFDMQFDWDATYIENADWNAVYVQVAWPTTGGGSNRVLMRMRNTTVDRNVSGYWESDGTPDGYHDSSEPSITTSKFRVRQSGTTIRLYYWKTSAWQEIQSPGKTVSGANVPTSGISIWAHAQGGDITVDFDNFTVSSGTVHANQTRKKIAIFSGGDQHTGDKCFTEIEHWDAVNETATLHVQVPTLISGTDTDLYLYEDINQPDQDYRLISEANDTFTGTTGDSPDQTKWTGTALINNNKLRFDRTAGTRWIDSRFLLEDDFDIEIDVDFVDDPEVLSWYYHLTIRNPVNNYFAQFEYGMFSQLPGPAQQLGTRFRWNGGGGNNDTDAQDGAQTTGKWRFTRVGSTVSGYYDYDGGGWVKLDDDTGGSVGTNPVEVIMGISWWTGLPDAIVDIDNFTVTSGTVTGFVDDIGGRPAQEVWDSSFKGVWHMAQEPSGADDTLDSTSNYVDGTSQNMEAADLKDGQVGKALEFDGVAEWVDMGDVATTDPGTGELTVEILAKRNASGIDDYFISKGNVSSVLEGWSIWQENSTNLLLVRCNASDDSVERASQSLVGGILDTNWHTVALVLDHTDEKIYGYKDGSNSSWIAGGGGPADDDITGFDIDTTDELAIAAARDAASTSRYANATIDEVRISSTARTPIWISTTHDSLFDDLVFYDLLGPTPTPPEPPTPSGLADAMGWTSINDVLTSGIVVRLYRRSDGSLVGEDISATISGIWNIPTTYDEYHYAIGLYPVSGTNSLIYDWLHPTLNP